MCQILKVCLTPPGLSTMPYENYCCCRCVSERQLKLLYNICYSRHAYIPYIHTWIGVQMSLEILDKYKQTSSTYLSTHCKVVLITSEVLGRVTDTLKPYQKFTIFPCCHLEKCVYMINVQSKQYKDIFSSVIDFLTLVAIIWWVVKHTQNPIFINL